MRRFLVLNVLVGLFAALGMAETFTGSLIDASCLTQPRPTIASCQPSSSTTTFALVDNSRKVYKLDAKGNAKAADAMKSHADRSSDPNAKPQQQVMATITGKLEGDTVTVETIQVE